MVLRLLISLLILLGPSSAMAQRVVSALSELEISIDSNFIGAKLTLFGNVEPDSADAQRPLTGPFDIILVIEGPPASHTVREKTNQFGVWLNSAGATFEGVPSFYYVINSRDPSLVADPETLQTAQIRFVEQIERRHGPLPISERRYVTQLQRLLENANLHGVSAGGVQFLSPTFYRAELELPANVPNGAFLAKTYLFSNGELVAQEATRFLVRTTGIERLIEETASDYPWLYGLICVLLALFTGWLGSVVFRR